MRDMKRCRGCGAFVTTTLLDLGDMPLANAYPRSREEAAAEQRFPLCASVCDECFLVQLAYDIAPSELFRDYAYFSSYSSSWLEHARGFAAAACQRFGLGRASRVLEVASNDGYLLRHFAALGVPVLGIEPAANVAEVAIASGVPTEVRFFGQDTAAELVDSGVRADLVVANNVVAHVPDLHDFIEGLRCVLAPGGVVSLEFPHLLRLLDGVQFDTIYHEHFSYLSLLALEPVLRLHGLRVFDVDQLTTHGGSIRVLACANDDRRPDGTGAGEVRAAEREARLDDLDTYASFAPKVEHCRVSVETFFDGLRGTTAVAVAYGAAAKGVTLLNHFGIGRADLRYVVDRSREKQGRFIPGVHLPIVDPSEIWRTRPDYVVVLPWNLRDEISDQLAGARAWGCRLVTVVPEVRLIS